MRYITYDLLEDLYKESVDTLKKVEAGWSIINSNILLASPETGAWSAVGCLDHLNNYGRYYLPAIEKALETAGKSKSPATFKSSWLGNYFYKLMLVDKTGKPKKKMSAPKNSRPHKNVEANAVLKEFIYQQGALCKLIKLLHEYDCGKIKIAISIAPFIKLSLGDTLLFYTAHIQRHIKQAERALLAAGYQPAGEESIHAPAKV